VRPTDKYEISEITISDSRPYSDKDEILEREFTVEIRVEVFWVVTPCSVVVWYQRSTFERSMLPPSSPWRGPSSG
jgi:hypothetical protein